MVRRVVLYLTDPNELKAAPVFTEDIVTSRAEDSDLADFYPRRQVPKPEALKKMVEQVNEAELHEEINHNLDPRDSDGIKVMVNVTKENGVNTPEAVKGLLEVWDVIDNQGGESKRRRVGYRCTW